MKRTTKLIGIILAIALAVTAVYMKGIYDGSGGKELALTRQAVAAQAKSTASPVKALAEREVYYPGSEDLAPDEMRVVACGTGMPNARPKQAAACWVVELGNGDKFIFDIGSGSAFLWARRSRSFAFPVAVSQRSCSMPSWVSRPSWWGSSSTWCCRARDPSASWPGSSRRRR